MSPYSLKEMNDLCTQVAMTSHINVHRWTSGLPKMGKMFQFLISFDMEVIRSEMNGMDLFSRNPGLLNRFLEYKKEQTSVHPLSVVRTIYQMSVVYGLFPVNSAQGTQEGKYYKCIDLLTFLFVDLWNGYEL